MPRYKLVNGERVQLTAEEETARTAEENAWIADAKNRSLANLRAKRDELLKASDWEVIAAKETGSTLSAAFKTYRQELRDLPGTVGDDDTAADVDAITFPTKP